MTLRSIVPFIKIAKACLAIVALYGCQKTDPTPLALSVDLGPTLFSGAEFTVDGFQPNEIIYAVLYGSDTNGTVSCGWANYQAPSGGSFAINQLPALSGSYEGIDTAGLFWSRIDCATLPDSLPRHLAEHHSSSLQKLGDFYIIVGNKTRSKGRRFSLPIRSFPKVEKVKTTPGPNLEGNTYLPLEAVKRTSLFWIGGTGGDHSVFAHRSADAGFVSTSISYFGTEGTPSCLNSIDVDAIKEMIVDIHANYAPNSMITLIGVSRGAEIATLISEDLGVSSMVLIAPLSNYAGGSVSPNCSGEPAWRYNSKAIPSLPGDLVIDLSNVEPHDFSAYQAQFYTRSQPQSAALLREVYLNVHPELDANTRIDIGRYSGSLRVFVGDDDQVTGRDSAHRVVARHTPSDQCESSLSIYENAGHQILGSEFTRSLSPIRTGLDGLETSGGTIEGNAKARRALWADLMRYFDQSSKSSACRTPLRNN